MAIKKGTLDELLSGRDPKEVFSKDGLFDELKKALAERVLNAELDDHLDGQCGGGQGQSPQWLFEEDGADRECQAGLTYSARSGRHVRPEADRPVSATVSGLRREDRLHVRARHDDPGDPGSSNGDLWARRVARPNLDSDRCSLGGRRRMAESAARADVSDRLL